MLRFHAEKFYWITQNLCEARFIAENSSGASREVVDKTTYNFLRQLKTICDEIGLKLSSRHINRILTSEELEESYEFPAGHYIEALKELHFRINDELAAISCFIVNTNPSYFDEPNLFGERVFNNFPSANFDIEEAGKCFAAARFTASVMHLQRVLEIGLKSYGNYLGIMHLISSPQPSWQNVLDKTGKEIKERNDKSNTIKHWKSDREKEFCEGVQPFLVAVKTAWRNPSMHAEAKYTEDEAREIFDAIKGFMRHLAEHLNEKGKFQKKLRK